MIVQCDNCRWVGPEADTNEPTDLWERVDEDGPEPDGECPDCGCLCYETNVLDAVERSVRP